MPRHPSLVPYSHEHHHALVLSLRLKKQGPTSQHDFGWPTEFWLHATEALKFLDTELEHHFHEEEAVLFPSVRESLSDASLIPSLLEQHIQLRALREDVRSQLSTRDEPTLRDTLQQLGVLLEQHVRKEERVLFPLIEQLL
jgi:iron-sulfur cluster repair protein YtfE (RIC family)